MDFLSVKGNKIVDSNGKPVCLKGTSIGGWMNMENFINGYPGTESGVRSAVADSIGEGKAEFLFERMMTYFFDEDDIKFIKECGANVVRLPLNYRHFEDDMAPFKYKEKAFERLNRIVNLCEKYELYIIFDMHAVQGWQNAHWHSDNPRGISLFWTHVQFQDRFIALWEEIVRRYAKKAVVAGYEIINEPCANTDHGDYPHNYYEHYRPRWDRFNSVCRRTVSAIRNIDPDHIIFLQGDNYGWTFEGMGEPFAENLVYSSHNYICSGFGPGAYPGEFKSHRVDRAHQNGYWDRNKQVENFKNHQGTQYAEKYNVPLWVGEFGARFNGRADEIPYRMQAMDDQIDVMEAFGVHWTSWTYKDVGVMGWVTLDPESAYMKRIAPIQKMKGLLGAENFTGSHVVSPAKKSVKALAALMEDIIGDPGIGHTSNNLCLAQVTLSGYAAGLLEAVYAKLFNGMSEEKIDTMMQSFAFKNCVIHKDFIKMLKKHFNENIV